MSKRTNLFFADITPKIFSRSTTAHSYAVAFFKNRIFLAVACYDTDKDIGRYEILCNDRLTKSWNTIFKKKLRLNCLKAGGRSAERLSNNARRIQPNSDPNDSTEKLIKAEIKLLPPDSSDSSTLYFLLVSDSESLLYQLNQDEKITKISQPAPELLRYFSLQSLVDVRDRTYALKWNKRSKRKLIYHKLFGRKQWRIVNTEDILGGNGSEISNIVVFDSALYVMVANRKMGFQVWQLDNDDENNCIWKHVIVNGANRYIFNERVLAAVPFGGALYLANGVTESEKNNPRYFSPTEFEIIRVYDNDDWDLIIGTPRFTPQGLKVPLSGLGPNTDDLSFDIFQNFFIYNNQLFLGYQDHNGFQIWMSCDGVNWTHISQNLFSNNSQVKVCKTISTPFGVVIVLDITDDDGNSTVELWQMTQS